MIPGVLRLNVTELLLAGGRAEAVLPGLALRSSWMPDVPGWPADRDGFEGFTNKPSDPRTQPLGGLSVGGKK